MKILAIYDNGGKTIDRYTVVTNVQAGLNMLEMLGLSEGGEGFSQWGAGSYAEGRNNRHLGKRVQFEQLSEVTQKHIATRVFGE